MRLCNTVIVGESQYYPELSSESLVHARASTTAIKLELRLLTSSKQPAHTTVLQLNMSDSTMSDADKVLHDIRTSVWVPAAC